MSLNETGSGLVSYAQKASRQLSIDTAGKLLRKALKSYRGNPRQVDELNFKQLFREGAKHGLIDPAAVEWWFAYRDNRNDTAHDYGLAFAEETLTLLPAFVTDARAFERGLQGLEA